MRICQIDDLMNPGALSFKIGEGDWPLRAFVVRQSDSIRAYVNRCPHAGHPLDLVPGRFLTSDGRAILCSSHAALFTPLDGRCFDGPCPGQMLQSIPIEVRDSAVWLSAAFDPSKYDP
jgi:nitrite reductase/ring-hydroxylating ferredoxin subunit